jgi:Dual specificity phosphatase, catalytic domain
MKPHDPANEIIPRLWLGNGKASMDAEWIQQEGINVVFNCTKDRPFSPLIPTKYRIPVDDNLQEAEIRNMELWASEIAYQILREYLQGRTILIHCAAGIQRSAAAVAFFLIVYHQQHGSEVMAFIKERRPVAFYPTANFLRAIQSFDQRFHSELLPEIQRHNRTPPRLPQV